MDSISNLSKSKTNDALRNIDLRDLRCLKDIFRITHNIGYQKCISFLAPIYARIKKEQKRNGETQIRSITVKVRRVVVVF